ncbi:response regulator [Lichenicola cladoniae]|uniref:histidine kinase n=1 Tax=Lichenicola cladoniae TaxID=1484109 RepID=A0A6M8HQL2_9PROT|nr:PAS domain-containing sensor histidine kinase [Lichenicola cladoniae]NPD68818.1 response regulator [Acetobacteraceae bacterium]QKE90763.1 response regulator [Lichenicola cladoniae]
MAYRTPRHRLPIVLATMDVRSEPVIDRAPEVRGRDLSGARPSFLPGMAIGGIRGGMEHAEAPLNDNSLYRILVDSVTDYAIFMLDPTGVVISWNAGAHRSKGYEAGEIIGRHFSRFYTDEDQAAGLPDLALQTSATSGTFRGEGWRVRKDGSRFWANVVVDPVRNGAGEIIGFAKVTRDVTDWKTSQTDLEQAREGLLQSQKMEAIGQLTGGIAHDFNNMLAGISGCLELMQARLSQGRIADLERYVDAAQNSTRRAASLTHRLLAFARQQTLSPKAVDVNLLVNGMEELIRRTTGPAITVTTAGTAELWTVLVDPHQLENALLNLCINARDAMQDGGRLTIEAANRMLDETAARTHGMLPGRYVSLCVSDTGTGMTPETIRRAFEPFFTTKPVGKGTGLGLSMIHGFAKQSGGQVRIYSEAGTGSMVCLYLPRHHTDADLDEVADLPLQHVKAGFGETVLVVDDEQTIRMLVCDVLTDMGYATREAGTGATALALLQSDLRIDMLITDIGLPGGMSGRQLVDAARATRPALKVLFITGYAENAATRHGIVEPGTMVLTKPFALATLADRIRGIITQDQEPGSDRDSPAD